MSAMFDLYTIAPRLAKARDDHRAWLIAEGHRKARAIHHILRAERLVAHRELQLLRAYKTGNGKYIRQRQHKLEAGKRELATARRRAA